MSKLIMLVTSGTGVRDCHTAQVKLSEDNVDVHLWKKYVFKREITLGSVADDLYYFAGVSSG